MRAKETTLAEGEEFCLTRYEPKWKKNPKVFYIVKDLSNREEAFITPEEARQVAEAILADLAKVED